MNKVCPICKISKPISDYHSYYSKSRQRIRYGNYCKQCAKVEANKRAKIHYIENRDYKLEYAKAYRKDPEKSPIIKELKAIFKKRYRENLQDCYVAEIFAKFLKTDISTVRASPELLQAYKTHVKLKRKIKSHVKKQNTRPERSSFRTT